MSDETKRPLWVKCGDCRHCWPVAYLPMNLSAMGRILKRIGCPMCGADPKRVFVAKQDNGVLQEPDQPAPAAALRRGE